MLSRTHLCRHKLSCYENIVNGFINTFTYSFVGKIILNNLQFLGNFAKLRKNLFSWKENKDHLQFSLFIGLMNGIYKMVLCLMRRLYKSDKPAALVAGFCAGLCLAIDKKNRRILLTILILSRFLESSYKMAEKNNVVKPVPHAEVAIWVLCNVA